MSNRSVVLIYPPLVERSYLQIYSSLPTLAASLEQFRFSVKQIDLNNAFIDWYLRSVALRKEISTVRRRHDALENESSLSELEYQQYDQMTKCYPP